MCVCEREDEPAHMYLQGPEEDAVSCTIIFLKSYSKSLIEPKAHPFLLGLLVSELLGSAGLCPRLLELHSC